MGWIERKEASELEVRFIYKEKDLKATIFGLSGEWYYEVFDLADRVAFGREEKLYRAKYEAVKALEEYLGSKGS